MKEVVKEKREKEILDGKAEIAGYKEFITCKFEK